MEKLKIKYIKLCSVIGFGYWKEEYDVRLGVSARAIGYTHNFILPFLRIQIGVLKESNT